VHGDRHGTPDAIITTLRQWITARWAVLLFTLETAMSASVTEGEVRKNDKGAKRITLKHGEIKNLEMPCMTMAFQVKDAALLDKIKAGDKVMFTAEKADGAIVVTSIEPGCTRPTRLRA